MYHGEIDKHSGKINMHHGQINMHSGQINMHGALWFNNVTMQTQNGSNVKFGKLTICGTGVLLFWHHQLSPQAAFDTLLWHYTFLH